MRRHADVPHASALMIAKASLYRVPQIVERILPFAVLIAAMSSFLTLSRRLEFVIARSAGMSAWQFTAPALIAALAVGAFATGIYNPVAALLAEQSKRMEAEISGRSLLAPGSTSTGIWLRQRGADGHSIMNAATSREQGLLLGTVTIFAFDPNNRFVERIEARAARHEHRPVAARERPRLRARRAAGRSRHLPAQHQPDRRAGPGNLLHAGNRAVLATARVHRARRERGALRGRVPVAVPEAAVAAVPARDHGPAGGRVQPALLPLRRRAEDGARRRGHRLPDLRRLEAHRRPEQGRTDQSRRSQPGCPTASAASADFLRCCTWRTGDGAFRHRSSAAIALASVHRSGLASLALATLVAGAWSDVAHAQTGTAAELPEAAQADRSASAAGQRKSADAAAGQRRSTTTT